MTAVPDPRFRDQLAEDFSEAHEPVQHRMLPGSHEQIGGPECVCGEEWSRWDDMCARPYRAAALASPAPAPRAEEADRG